jgi:4-hydroxybenzoate polyprenyltransferase
MAYLPTEIIRVARPVHWVKNLALFAALIFDGKLLNKEYLVLIFWAFVSFSLITSAAYIFNDIMDRKRDAYHPIKKKRPIASGNLPIVTALVVMVVFVSASLFLASLLNFLFFSLVLAYLLLQISYSLLLKNLTTIDILVIASGFIIRVYAGALVVDAHLSVWFLLCVISVALFLASGKRRAELNILSKSKELTRKSLVGYKQELLNSYVTMFGNAAWMSWALFTFHESPNVTLPVWLFLAELSRTTTVSKLLMSTIPVVIFAIMRYQMLIYQGRSEAPEKVILTDKALVASVAIWVALVVWILYGGLSVSTF